MYRVYENEIVVREVFRHVVGYLFHAGLKRRKPLVAHHDDESVVGLHIPRDDEKVVPVVEKAELGFDGIVLVYVAQDVERLFRPVKEQLAARVLRKVPHLDDP